MFARNPRSLTAPEAQRINKIKEGAFLTVKSARALNTMIIGWAAFGIVWAVSGVCVLPA